MIIWDEPLREVTKKIEVDEIPQHKLTTQQYLIMPHLLLIMLCFAQRNPDKLGWTHEKAQANPRRKRIAVVPPPLSKSNASVWHLSRPAFSPLLSFLQSPPERQRRDQKASCHRGPTRQPPVAATSDHPGRNRREPSLPLSRHPPLSTILGWGPIPRLLKDLPARRAVHRSKHQRTRTTKKPCP